MLCKVCGSQTTRIFTACVLGKYETGYHQCGGCGFIQTDEPFWLAESYASAINDIDLGPVNRAITGSRLIEGIILSSFDRNGAFVDYGGGYGVLVRLMRDRGFDFYWRDPFCENLFAKHFVAKPGMRFEMLTAFEVFEHLADPMADIERMVETSDNLLFSTLLVPPRVSKVSDWWYFGPEHGQHIAFFTRPALEFVARKFRLHLASDGFGLHLLSKRRLSDRRVRFFAADRRWAQLARWWMRRSMRKQSLLSDDFLAVSGHQL